MMISKEVKKGQLEKKKILHSFSLFLFSSCPSHIYNYKPTQQPITTTLDSKKQKKKKYEEKKKKNTKTKQHCLTIISEIFAAILE